MHEDIAQCFMDYADQLQSGSISENRSYPRRYLDWISLTAGNFFDKYPQLLTSEVIELIALGEEDQKRARFGHIAEFYPLNEAVVNYFNSVRPKADKATSLGFWRSLLSWSRPQMTSKVPDYSTVNG